MKAQLNRLIVGIRNAQSGFTLVELLVVVTIVVALAAASVASVIQFAGKGEEGAAAAESGTIQAAMDAMMASTSSVAVTANDLTTVGSGIQDFAAVPVEGPLATYIRDNPATYYYCWDVSGKVLQLLAAGACPAGPY